MRKIGILALQGDFEKHELAFSGLGAGTVRVKVPDDMNDCDGLVIPGGESTTMTKLMHAYGLYEPVREFAGKYPVMGTCAGMIMVASTVDDERVTPLNLIDISVSRNSYGRQIDSFITGVEIPSINGSGLFRAIFIRAPQVMSVGPKTDTLAELKDKPVMVRNENTLALSFHPELTDDVRIHRYFLERF